MSQFEDFAKRISLLEAESEIRKIIHNYCLKQDKKDLEGFLSLFTDDFCLSFPGWNLNLKGKEVVKDYFVENVFPNYEFSVHQCHNINIEISGEKAEAEGYFSVHSLCQGQPQEAQGMYAFKLRKGGGQWKLSHVDARAIVWKGSLAPQDPNAYERFTWPPKKHS